MTLLETKNLLFGYGKSLTQPLNLNVKEGEVLALIGPNGCGKSTLLKTLGNLEHRINGTINIYGKSIDSYSLRELSKKICFVYMNLSVYSEMSVYEFVLLGRSPYAGFFDKRTKEDVKIVKEAMDYLDVNAFSQKSITELSDGERSRVFLAKALAQQARILFLDEPDAFFDLPRKRNFFVLIKKLAESKKMGVVLSTHSLDFSEKYADSILSFCGEGTLKYALSKDARQECLFQWAEE